MGSDHQANTLLVSSEEHNLAASIGKNTIFGVVARVAQVGTRLVTIPFVIGHLGLGAYGIWAIIMSAAAYMRFGSIGAKSAFQKYVAEATGTGDYEHASRLLSTGSAVMLALSVAGLIPISLFSRTLARAAGVPPEFLASAAGAISVLALIMVLSNAGAAFEAIVMGGHRIDLARRFTTIFTISEAIAIIVVLHFGFGLFAMAAIMGLSEVGFVTSCYWASRRVVPQVWIARRYITRDVLGELCRYAGSYQILNVLQVVYQAIVPVAILRAFGAEAAGVYALAVRLQGAALMLPDAFVVPVLSGGARVFASGSKWEMERLLRKSFKVTLALTLLPLGFIAVFGVGLVYAWTGQSSDLLRPALRFASAAGLFTAFSILGLVLYRVSGKALLDNVRQAGAVVALFVIALFASRLRFYGVLAGLAAVEFAGAVFMLFAVAKTFRGFSLRSLFPDSAKLLIVSVLVMTTGALAGHLPVPILASARGVAALRLGYVCLGCAAMLWPALMVTKSISAGELRTISSVFSRRRFASTAEGD